MLKPRSTCFLLLLLVICTACHRRQSPHAAFYYWKTSFALSSSQQQLLASAGNNTLYLRFFDVVWNEGLHQPRPDAVLRFNGSVNGLHVEPVIFITNRTFKQIGMGGVDSLARRCARLMDTLTMRRHLRYAKIQVDCDWTDETRARYFAFLKAFKQHNRHLLEATIRLHQVKYRERTGVPPADRGVLMFYNMGALAPAGSRSSIYNEQDAARYLGRVNTYPMPLDVALPLFSWVVQSRGGHIIQLYTRLTAADLQQPDYFEAQNNVYRAIKSFFLKGIYIKQNDIFKVEETDLDALKKAAAQLSGRLAPLPNRTVIYYELANINQPQFTPEALNQVTHRF